MGNGVKSVTSGALTGASVGAAFGPWGAAIGGAGGGLLGGLSSLFGGGETEKLIRKQKEMAEESKRRMRQNEQARLNSLGQSMLAFNPRNQVMAEMFGPEAAFSPDQMAQMAQDPRNAERNANWGKGTDEQRIQQVKDQEAERARQEMIRRNMTPLPKGPAPLQARTPQPGRRY